MSVLSSGETWRSLIQDVENLVTSQDAIVSGFAEQARVKAEKAFPLTERANELRIALESVEDIGKLMDVSLFRLELIAAAGISQKASGYFSEQQLQRNVMKVLERVYDRCVEDYSEKGADAVRAAYHAEIVSRYLLTAGATFDGQMRNWTGARAQEKVIAALIAALSRRGISPQYEEEPIESFTQATFLTEDTGSTDDLLEEPEPEGKLSRLRWSGRLLLFNIKPTMISKGEEIELNNIDMVLLNAEPTSSEEILKQEPARYLACGELKGGIDPAGADEHWKTASAALDRIRKAFEEDSLPCPALFFIGAVIVSKKRLTKRTRSMAHEIFERLNKGVLDHAANLTQPAQLEALADWLVSL